MIPRNEYPRPQFIREDWQCLNGEWAFETDPGDSGEPRGLHLSGAAYTKKIAVPFTLESQLSGLGLTDYMAAVWYRRTVTIDESHLTGRILLHIGAADYHTAVYVNGTRAGGHKGGYSSFCVDITDQAQKGNNEIVLHCRDDVRSPHQPSGKQSVEFHSRACNYTRTTGIWQSVWLEYAGSTYLENVQVSARHDSSCVLFSAKVAHADKPLRLRTTISYQGAQLCVQDTPVGSQAQYALSLPEDQLHPWDIGQPNLYDVRYELFDGDTLLDKATSYFGLRSVDLYGNRFCLNGRPIFQRLVLDQGFYPDGIITARSDEALKADIELSLRLGFNGARLHQKVFEERFLYWADHLGYLVWGEYPCWGLDISSPEGLMAMLPEWLEAVARDYNHPSIVCWCPFNETWDFEHRRQDDRVLEMVYLATKAADHTRPVVDTSGNYHVRTDLYDIHDYEQNTQVFAERYGAGQELYNNHADRQSYGGQPYLVSEFGGAWWAPGKDDGWGYGKAPATEEEFISRYEALTKALLDNPDICGYCYTQLTDVEQEQNGLVAYDRSHKFTADTYRRIHAANTAPAAIEQ